MSIQININGKEVNNPFLKFFITLIVSGIVLISLIVMFFLFLPLLWFAVIILLMIFLLVVMLVPVMLQRYRAIVMQRKKLEHMD